MCTLDGIEIEDDDEDYGVEDIAEDDSLVGIRPCQVPRYVPVLNQVVQPWYLRDGALLMPCSTSTAEVPVPSGATTTPGSVSERGLCGNRSTNCVGCVRPKGGSPWPWSVTISCPSLECGIR